MSTLAGFIMGLAVGGFIAFLATNFFNKKKIQVVSKGGTGEEEKIDDNINKVED